METKFNFNSQICTTQGVFGMNAADLMIGDWVGVFDDKGIIKDCRQVDWIRTGEIGMRYQKVWAIGCIEPILLTPEILEKNGWEHNGIFMDKRIDGNIYFSWSDKFGAELYQNNYYMCYCKYVHTLQHALRLCGFDDIADNFKV